jgi:two-component sensor histidine kinase
VSLNEEQTVDSCFDPKPSSSLDDNLLVRELSHRIINEFVAMIGLVSLAAARSTGDEVKNALEEAKILTSVLIFPIDDDPSSVNP